MPVSSPLYIVSGATGGIGGAVAEALARQGKPLMLACRNMKAAAKKVEQLTDATGNTDIQALMLDLSSFDAVRHFVEEVKRLERPVAALVNVAGAMSRDSSLTADGYELDIQVNCLSTALLARLLAPMIPSGGHIIFTSSVTRKIWNLADVFPHEPHFSQLGTYGRSKLALTIFAHHFAAQVKAQGIRVACADPGVVNTGMISMHRWFDFLADIFFRPFISSPAQGARPMLAALSDEDTCLMHCGNSSRPLVMRQRWEAAKPSVLAAIPER